jgi:sporulation protein YlmC with PRC-barrel domain
VRVWNEEYSCNIGIFINNLSLSIERRRDILMEKRPHKEIMGKAVVTKEGKKLGSVKDITFETRTGELMHVVVKDSSEYTAQLNLERSQHNEILIPYNSIVAIGDFVVVSEEDLV